MNGLESRFTYSPEQRVSIYASVIRHVSKGLRETQLRQRNIRLRYLQKFPDAVDLVTTVDSDHITLSDDQLIGLWLKELENHAEDLLRGDYLAKAKALIVGNRIELLDDQRLRKRLMESGRALGAYATSRANDICDQPIMVEHLTIAENVLSGALARVGYRIHSNKKLLRKFPNPELLIFLEDVFQSYLDAGGKLIQSDVTGPNHRSVHRFLETVLDPLRDYYKGLKQLTASDINGQITDFLSWSVSFSTKKTEV